MVNRHRESLVLALNVEPQVHQRIQSTHACFRRQASPASNHTNELTKASNLLRKAILLSFCAPPHDACRHHESSHNRSGAGSFRVFITHHTLHKGTPLDAHFAPHHAYSVTLLWIHSLLHV